jgi:hypothetical protein
MAKIRVPLQLLQTPAPQFKIFRAGSGLFPDIGFFYRELEQLQRSSRAVGHYPCMYLYNMCKVQLPLVCSYVCQIAPSFFGRSSQQNQAAGRKPASKASTFLSSFNKCKAVFKILFHIFLLKNA